MQILSTNIPKATVVVLINTVWTAKLKYVHTGGSKIPAEELLSVETMDTDEYRNGGTAAAGAIIGGILTGGIGLLAGAAFGGRKKGSRVIRLRFTEDRQVVAELSMKQWKKHSKVLLPYCYRS